MLLPWFGGSAGVWATCLVFFQCQLLLGYVYSHWLVSRLRPKAAGPGAYRTARRERHLVCGSRRTGASGRWATEIPRCGYSASWPSCWACRSCAGHRLRRWFRPGTRRLDAGEAVRRTHRTLVAGGAGALPGADRASASACALRPGVVGGLRGVCPALGDLGRARAPRPGAGAQTWTGQPAAPARAGERRLLWVALAGCRRPASGRDGTSSPRTWPASRSCGYCLGVVPGKFYPLLCAWPAVQQLPFGGLITPAVFGWHLCCSTHEAAPTSR